MKPFASRLTILLLLIATLWQTPIFCQDNQTSSDDSEKAEGTSTLKKLNDIEGISEYRLDNGVRVLLFPDQSKEVVTVNMTIFVGSRHEGYGEAGMAHLLEHMLFKGTPAHQNIPKALQDRGARFNGTTWVDRTNYYETLPATEDNLRFALELEADRLMNSFIKGEDLESEMTVVRSEFERGENSPSRVLMQRMQSAAYDWHNYGQSTIGNRSDIERVPIVNLRRFYRKYYRPDNVMLVVAGKFDPEVALEMVQESFGVLASPDTPIDATYTTEPPQDGERTVVLRRVGDVQLVGSAYHVPAASHPDFAAIKALAIILRDQPSGRLYREMVEAKMASSVYTFAFAFAEPGIMMTLIEVPEDHSVEQARTKMIDVLEESFDDQPITDQEVERAKQQILKNRELEAADSDRIAISLSEWAAQGDWRLYFLYRDIVEKLTAEKVQQAASKYLVRNNRTVGLFLPTETSERIQVPEAPNLAAILDGYEGREVVQAGEQFDPDPLAIEKRTLRGDLTEGIRYALLPKQTRGGTVNLGINLRYGTAESMIDRLGAIELIGIMMRRGTERLGYQELQDEMTRLRAEVSLNSTPSLLQISVKTKREFLPEVIALLGEILRSPKFDPSELDVLKQQIITNLEQQASEPRNLAMLNVRRRLSPYGNDDIRYVRTLEEEIEMYRGVTIEQIKKAYEELFSSKVGELYAVGDFDPEEIKAQVQEILKDWDSDIPYVRFDRPANENAEGGLIELETPDKANSFYYSQFQLGLEDDSPEYASLVLGNYILGGGGLSSRLADRVRQKEGLSYTVGSAVSARAKDERVDFTIYAIAAPENKERLIAAIREEIERLISDGVTEDELANAKQAYLQAARVRRTNDGALAGELSLGLFLDRTMQHAADHAKQIESASVDSVNSALSKFIDWDRLVGSIAGDFAAAAKKESEE